MLGRELEDIFPVGFLPPNQALFVAIMSYNGGINFGLLADYDSMDDLELIAEGIERSIAELAEAAEAAGEAPEPEPADADAAPPRAASGPPCFRARPAFRIPHPSAVAEAGARWPCA